jgi:hypothetical protein
MFNAFLLLFLGIGGSILAIVVVSFFVYQFACRRSERNCELKTYFNWVMQKGTNDQKRTAESLYRQRNLEGLKSLVGDSFLVDQ